MAELKKALSEAILSICHLKERVSLSSMEDVAAYLKQHILEHYAQNISLQELALHKFYLNASYLSRLFKQKNGISFRQFLTQVRMEKACEMLSVQGKSIVAIALECGYADASQFIQIFRRQYGITPNAWREKNTKQSPGMWTGKSIGKE